MLLAFLLLFLLYSIETAFIFIFFLDLSFLSFPLALFLYIISALVKQNLMNNIINTNAVSTIEEFF